MDKKDAIDKLDSFYEQLVTTDDELIRQIKSLKLVLLNLKIQTAHLKDAQAVNPIADVLATTIEAMEREVNELIQNNRETVKEAIDSIK